jgi:hypothetical protein
MADDRELRTRFSMAALDLASMFKMRFGGMMFGQVKWRAELDAPSTVSTDGGRQAIQHLRLVPGAQGFAPIMAGTVNGPQGLVELRIFDYVDAAHRQRFGKGAPIDRASYDQFFHQMREFFGAMRMNVNALSTPAELHSEPEPEPTRSIVPWIIAALVAVGIGVGIFFALRKG